MTRRRDEPVRLTRIYTRGGDAGETSLGDGTRVSKLDPRVVALGTVDEVNAVVGRVLALGPTATLRSVLESVQNDLFDVGADLCVPVGVEGRLRVTQEMIDRLETECDRFNDALPELRSFVLPGGAPAAAGLQFARTVCRRAEREALAAEAGPGVSRLAVVYLNRLSDLLFILARTANVEAGHPEPLWKPGGER